VTAVVVKGQRIFHDGIPGTVLDNGRGFAIVELDDGRVLIAAEGELQTAESPESAQHRQTPS